MSLGSVRSALLDAIRRAFGGRPVILAGPVARGLRRWSGQLRAAGLERPLILAEAAGGDPPTEVEGAWYLVPAGPAGERLGERLSELPPSLSRVIDAFDPDRRAVLLCVENLGIHTVQGRPVYGPQPARCARVESKGAADAWFDRAGVARLPSAILELADPELRRASRALDRGDGVAWSGVDDALVQPASGARLVRRVRTAAEADEAHATLSEGCARVRLAPFVEGIPCGVNALVFPDGVPSALLRLRRLLAAPSRGRRSDPWRHAANRGRARRTPGLPRSLHRRRRAGSRRVLADRDQCTSRRRALDPRRPRYGTGSDAALPHAQGGRADRDVRGGV